MATKIIVHLAIEISDDGTIGVQRASYSLGGRKTQGGPIRPDEITAIAQAFVSINRGSAEPPLPEDLPELEGLPLFLDSDAGPSAAARGQRLCGTPPPPPLPPAAGKAKRITVESAIADCQTAGVSVPLARQLVTAATAARVSGVAKWMLTQEAIRDPDALLRKLMAR